MLTRKFAIKRVRQCVDYLEFKSRSEFKPGILPTKQEVLERLIYEDKWRQKEAANTVAEELFKIWIHCNVYCISVSAISWRISKLVDELRKIDSISKKEDREALLSRKQSCS